ncbi:MAG: hypothetical protein ACREOZ_01945, partial [Gloeomargaritales cyanobacterium]
CGTALDCLSSGKHGDKYFGSHPEKSQLIVMEKPNLEKLLNLKRLENLKPITENGLYSRILATNARMLCIGVIPALRNELVAFTPDGLDENARLEYAASLAFIMDFATRKYVTLNGLKNKGVDKSKVISNAFKLLVNASLQTVEAKVPVDCIDDFKIDSESEYQLLLFGLVRSDVGQTSPALKFLACYGQAAPLDAGIGASLEAIIVLHLKRCLTVRGYAVSVMQLQEGWPRPLSKGKSQPDAAQIDELLEYLEEDAALKDVEKIVTLVRKLKEENNKKSKQVAIVLQQGVLNAQGPDVVVVVCDDRTYSIDVYQAKNVETLSKAVMVSGASSLGVIFNSGAIAKTGKAGYSNKALDIFREKLDKKLREPTITSANRKHKKRAVGEVVTVAIRKRVLVTSLSVKQVNDKFLKNDGALTVWTKELLEPTISAIAPVND